jgi:signal transduction histidine kinase
MIPQALLSDDEIMALAPLQLPSLRQRRYAGDGMSIEFAHLPETARLLIVRLYTSVQAIHHLMRQEEPPREQLDRLNALLQQIAWSELLGELRRLQFEMPTAEQQRRADQVLHDIRGGSFQALSIHVQLAEMGVAEAEDAPRVFLLARDHLKIMRNCLPELDPERYRDDMQAQAHSVQLLVEKWGRGSYQLPDSTVQVRLDCRFDGSVSERCVEFSALDRVLYNLMNNAARHSSDRRVALTIVPLNDAPTNSLRFVIANHINDEQRERLETHFGGAAGLGRLFLGGFTTGGNGLGMRIGAEFVTNAYGLANIEQALERGYVGATMLDQRFVNWFHWPVVAD